MGDNEFQKKRKNLVKDLIIRGYISNNYVIQAMEQIPRHLFVDEKLKKYAYDDKPLSIGLNQTISAPHMVGIMAENLDLINVSKVLEIGTGCGYHASVIAKIIENKGHVYSIERIEKLAERARENIKNVGLENIISVFVGDGSAGLKEFSPYDRILVTCGSPDIPIPLIDQLAESGKLILPVGGRYLQELISVEKKDGKVIKKNLGGVAFVPLIGEHGF